MKIETPYRTSAALSLEMKIIELGSNLEKYAKNYSTINIDSFAKKLDETLLQFGYKKLSRHYVLHKPDMAGHNGLLCLDYYHLNRRLILLGTFKSKDYGGAFAMKICYTDKFERIDEIIKMNSVINRTSNWLFPNWGLQSIEYELYLNINRCSYNVDNSARFLAMF